MSKCLACRLSDRICPVESMGDGPDTGPPSSYFCWCVPCFFVRPQAADLSLWRPRTQVFPFFIVSPQRPAAYTLLVGETVVSRRRAWLVRRRGTDACCASEWPTRGQAIVDEMLMW